MNRRILWAIAGGTVASSLALAQFAVVDVSSIQHLIQQSKQMLQEYQLLTDTYRTINSTYAQISMNAQMLTGKGGWRYAIAPLRYPGVGGAYGSASAPGWMRTLNGGLESANSYERATVRATTPDGIIERLSTTGRSSLQAQLASVDLTDGAAQHAMSVSGAARANATAQAGTLDRLEGSTFSDDPAHNTEVAVLNKVNAAAVIAARSSQDTNQLLAAIADQQTVEAKLRRDALVSEMNASAAAQAEIERNKQMLMNGNRAAHSARLP